MQTILKYYNVTIHKPFYMSVRAVKTVNIYILSIGIILPVSKVNRYNVALLLM